MTKSLCKSELDLAVSGEQNFQNSDMALVMFYLIISISKTVQSPKNIM